ncbi:MAG: alpha/beta hydrolase [Bacteroidaceae bacterium]|nr:alpha/beta hydrolase [Bacteroidaceae bacterium]
MNTNKIKTTFILLFLSLTSFAQEGAWSGELNVQGVKLPLVFNFSDEGCTMDSPAQGVKGVKTEWKRADDGSVNISIPLIGGSYTGQYDGKEIKGVFKQHGMSFPLDLTNGVKKANRPQTPVAPFPYKTEEVTFTNGDAVLKGTLTIPEGCSKDTPVFVMVTGSGFQNRDEAIFEHKPFAVIADALARNGIATMRYDDRGFGESKGDVINCTTEDLKKDALAGVNLMRKRFSKVGVIGHSEGGTIGLLLASEKQVDYVVSLAGGVTSMKECLVWQNSLALKGAGLSDDVVNAYCKALDRGFDDMMAGKNYSDVSLEDVPDILKDNFVKAMQQSSTPYFRYFLSLDARKCLSDIKCPVLGLNGKLDNQVQCDINLKALEQGVTNKSSKVVAFDGLNHLFQHCKTGAITEYQEIEETISPDVLNMMVEWIKQNK